MSSEERRAEVIERWRRIIDEHERNRRHSEANRARMELHKELRGLDCDARGE